MNREDCPCKRKKCKRHGDCEACRAHHAKSRRKLPCEQGKKPLPPPENSAVERAGSPPSGMTSPVRYPARQSPFQGTGAAFPSPCLTPTSPWARLE